MTIRLMLGALAAVLLAVPAAAQDAPAVEAEGEVFAYLMQSGVEQNTSPNTDSRGRACRDAISNADLQGDLLCSPEEHSTSECFDCFNDGDRNNPDWTCSARWSCVSGNGLSANLNTCGGGALQ